MKVKDICPGVLQLPGKILVTFTFLQKIKTVFRPRNAPPISCSTCLLSGSRTPNTQRNACFIGGDFRTDENVALAAHQTLWVTLN